MNGTRIYFVGDRHIDVPVSYDRVARVMRGTIDRELGTMYASNGVLLTFAVGQATINASAIAWIEPCEVTP